MPSQTLAQSSQINSINTADIAELVETVKSDPANGIARFNVSTHWQGGLKSKTNVRSWSLGGQVHPRHFDIDIDEPSQLAGTNTAANPQEYLMAAMNACIMATWVAVCSLEGITLESLSIESDGELDLRGFLGLDENIRPGYEQMHYTVRIRGNGTERQYRRIADVVARTSPNYYNIANAIDLAAELVIE